MIYKLLRAAEWESFRAARAFSGSPVDRAEGFIHFSTAAQVRETAARHFKDERELILAEIDPAKLSGALKWEPAPSRAGQMFPHLYGPLPLSAVTRSWPLPIGRDGKHSFPGEVTEDR